ncbi:MAG: right-handed parallel beta-helix repeat-containing protein [Candidatus Limnocylindrales bacterium]
MELVHMYWDGTRWIDDPAPSSAAAPGRLPRPRWSVITAVSSAILVSSLITTSIVAVPLASSAAGFVPAGTPALGLGSFPSPSLGVFNPGFGPTIPVEPSTLPATSDPTATPAPTQAPVHGSKPTPKPTPRPAPKPRPKPAPKPPAGIAVPSSVNSSGSADASAALNSFIARVPNGSTIVFRSGGTYRLDRAIRVSGRKNLTFYGNHATLKGNGGSTEPSSLFWLINGSGLKIENFAMVGNSTSPGVYIGGREGAMGVLVDGADNVDISGNTVRSLWGDFVEVNSGASGVRIHSNTVVNTGRNAMSVIWGNHVEFDHNTVTRAGYVIFDVEPNNSGEPSSYVTIIDNHTGYYTDAWFAVDGSHTGASIHNITVANNVSTGKTLLTVVDSGGRKQDISFTGNRSNVTSSSTALMFKDVDGLKVTGNVQKTSHGAIASFVSCTHVTKDF